MAQEEGFVNESFEAILYLRLANGSKIECVIDTGFNGSFLLPRSFVEDNLMRFVGKEEVTMVEQNTTFIETALATVDWLGENFAVQILVSEHEECLIGTQMLIDSKLEIDYKNFSVKLAKEH
jgi:clan AA aspartic protease